MIRLLTEDRVADFTCFCEKRLTGAVIYTRFLTYGLYSGEVFFWYSEDDNENLNVQKLTSFPHEEKDNAILL